MARIRVIPTLLLKGHGFVKTVKFSSSVYLGDPINIVRIFNEKEADEIIILDVAATLEERPPDFALLRDIATECLMPLGYGGGVSSLEEMGKLFQIGCEKICLNTAAFEKPELVKEASRVFGSQSIVVSIDVRRDWLGRYDTYLRRGRKRLGLAPSEAARRAEDLGAGEILITSIDRDGTYSGYELDVIKQVRRAVRIPVIACGGAGKIEHFREAVTDGGADAVAAGSFFVFHGPHRAVLINMPSAATFDRLFANSPDPTSGRKVSLEKRL